MTFQKPVLKSALTSGLMSAVLLWTAGPAFSQAPKPPVPPMPPVPPVAIPVPAPPVPPKVDLEIALPDLFRPSQAPMVFQIQPSGTAAKPAKKISEMGLDEMLKSALQNHAEIVHAQAKVRDAEMDLIRVRQKILVQIAVKRAEFEAARATYNEAKVRKEAADRLLKEKAISSEDAKAADLAMLRAKAEMTRCEASLAASAAVAPPGVEDIAIFKVFTLPAHAFPGTAGMRVENSAAVPMISVAPAFGGGTIASTTGPTAVPVTAPLPGTAGFTIAPDGRVLAIGTAATSPIAASQAAQKLLKKLTMPVTLPIDDWTLAEVIDALGQKVELVTSLPKEKLTVKSGTANFKNLPLGAAMQWVEDTFKVKLIVRDYGIVVTEPDRVPPGALTVMDVWRQSDQSLQGNSPRDVLYAVPGAAPGQLQKK